jgi:hypothetical protein
MNKEKTTQSKHDEQVKNIAEELKRDSWQVKANIEGWEKPTKKGKIVPDVEAFKGDLKRICEVIKPENLESNRKRYQELKNYCNEYDFHMYIIDKEGKRKQIDPQTFGKK